MPGTLTITFVGLALALALALATLLALDRLALKVVRPRRRPHRRDPGELEGRVECVTLADGVPLQTWWITPRERSPHTDPALVVLIHGWGANAAVMLGLAQAVADEGHPVVVFDVRNHGRSGAGPWVTLGQFVVDTTRVLEHVRARRPGARIVLGGHSMGGAAAVIVGADDPSLAGVVLVAAPHDMYGTLTRYLRDHGMPGGAMVRLLRPFWRPRLGRPAAQLDPGIRAPEIGHRVLVVQPENDARVPPENGRELARDTGGTLFMVPAADHNDVLDDPRVHHAVATFVAGR